MLRRFFRRAANRTTSNRSASGRPVSNGTASTGSVDATSGIFTIVPPLSGEHRRQTDAALASLVRNGVLYDDENDLDEVYEYVRVNGPDDPCDPIEFGEVVGSVASTLDPLTNLAFIPRWSEVTATDVEEFAESICWLAGINTSAIALASANDPSTLTVRFEIESGLEVAIETRLVPKGIPEGLIEGLADLLDPILEPRRLVVTFTLGHCVISALDPARTAAVNDETNAGYLPARLPSI
ncbi:MAG: hypothetical protein R2733_17800 [Acidimicrobiales bacterium]